MSHEACRRCGAPKVAEEWTGIDSLCVGYLCGLVERCGRRPEILAPCPAPDRVRVEWARDFVGDRWLVVTTDSHVVKPRFFGSVETWRADKGRDGFFVGPDEVRGRFAGREYRLGGSGARREYEGPGFKLAFDAADPEGTLSGTAESGADLTYWRIMEDLRTAVLSPAAVNYLNDAGP